MSWGETIFLKKIIEGNKRFVVSDNVLVDYGTPDLPYSEYGVFGSFTPKINGQLYLKVDVRHGSATGTSYIRLYEDDTAILSIRQSAQNTGSYIKPFSVNKNKTYRIKGTYSESGGELTKLQICGQTVDGNVFDYSVGEVENE